MQGPGPASAIVASPPLPPPLPASEAPELLDRPPDPLLAPLLALLPLPLPELERAPPLLPGPTPLLPFPPLAPLLPPDPPDVLPVSPVSLLDPHPSMGIRQGAPASPTTSSTQR